MTKPIGNNDVRVFISSTFNDLHSERNYLNQFVFPKVKSFCEDNGLQFTTIDLRWGVSREESENGKVVERCLDEIDQSRPYFIGILGERYGWIPNAEEREKIFITDHKYNEPINRLKVGYSITDLEIQYGVLDSPEMYDNSFFLFKENFDKENIPNEFSLTLSDHDDIHRNKLQSLKEKIRDVIPNEQIRQFSCSYKGIHLDYTLIPEFSLTDQEIESLQSLITSKDFLILKDYNILSTSIQKVISKYCVLDQFNNRFLLSDKSFSDKINLISSLSTNEKLELKEISGDKLISRSKFHCLSTTQKKLLKNYGYVEFDGFNSLGEWLSEKLIDEIRSDKLSLKKELSKIQQEMEIHRYFRIEKSDCFVKRDNIEKQLEAYLNGNTNVPYFVLGDAGSGKSSILANFLNHIEIQNEWEICSRFIGASNSSVNITSLLLSVAEELELRFNYKRPESVIIALDTSISQDTIEPSNRTNSFQILSNYLNTLLQNIALNNKIVLSFDAVDHLEDQEQPFHLNWLPKLLHQNLKIICTSTRPNNDSSGEVRKKIFDAIIRKEFNSTTLPALTELEQEDVISSILGKYGKSKGSFNYQNILVKKMVGNPFYLSLVSEELRIFPQFEYLQEFILQIPETIEGIIKNILDRLEIKFGYHFVSDALSLIVFSIQGVSETEIRAILQNQHSQDFSILKWRNLYHSIRPYLTRGIEDTYLMKFQYRQFRTQIKNRYSGNTESILSHLANYGAIGLEKKVLAKNSNLFNTELFSLIYLARIDDSQRINKIFNLIGCGEFDDYIEIFSVYILWLAKNGLIQDYPSFKNSLRNTNIYFCKNFLFHSIEKFTSTGTTINEWIPYTYKLYIDSLKEISKNNPMKIEIECLIGRTYSYLAQYCKNTGDYNKAIDYFKKACSTIEGIDSQINNVVSISLAHAYDGLGSLLERQNNFEEAMIYYNKSLQLNS